MKKILFNICFVFCLISLKNANAQINYNIPSIDNYSINYTYYDAASSSTKTTTPGPNEKSFSPKNPGFILWCEFGDGGFTLSPSFTHAYSTSATISNPLVKITGIYEGGGRPHRIINSGSLPKTNNISGNSPVANNLNYPTNLVSITPSVSSISSGDTMHFAISYKKPGGKKTWRLVFKYNTNNNAFQQTTATDLIMDPVDGITTNSFVRTHKGETPTYGTDIITFDNLPINNEFYNTVFVTLVPQKGEDLAGQMSQVEAYLINEDNQIEPSSNANADLMNTGTNPHDPNYINVDKYCIKPSTAGKTLHYDIHFQNTGTGPANEMVRVALKVPIGIIPNQINHTSTVVNLKADYANTTITSFQNFILTSPPTFADGVLYYDNTTRTDSVIFIVKTTTTSSTILAGMDITKPNYMMDKTTMGNIHFTLTLPSYSPVINLDAQVSIIFDTEDEVLTNVARTVVKRNCRKKADCNCNGKKRSFWEWLKERCE